MTERNPVRADQEGRRWRAYRWALERASAVQLVAGKPVDDTAVARSHAAERWLVRCRNLLATYYLDLVHREANRMSNRLPSAVQVEDLVSEGLFGLMNAIAAFDPSVGARFTTFAPYRIRSAMLDYLRSVDPTPRLMRQRARKVAETRQQFYQSHGRPPTDEEVGQHLNLDADKLKRWLDDAKLPGMSSLNATRRGDEDNASAGMAAGLADRSAANPAREALRGAIKEWLLRRMTRAERLIVVLYYGEGMTMKEIGTTLDLSESRVSQMMTSIRARMKVMTAGHHDDLAVSA